MHFQKSKTHFGRILDLRGVVFLVNVAISFSFFSTITITTSTCLNRRDPVQKKDLTLEKVLNKLNKQHLSQQEILSLHKVAEFRIQRYSSAIKNMGLRRILDFCEKYPVAFSIASQATLCFVSGRVEQGPLKDEYLDQS